MFNLKHALQNQDLSPFRCALFRIEWQICLFCTQIVILCSVTVFVAWCNIWPHCRQHITASNNHIQLLPQSLHALWLLRGRCSKMFKKQAQRNSLPFAFHTISHSSQWVPAKVTHTHTHAKHTLGWLRQCALVIPDGGRRGVCSRQIQLAMLVHSTKPFVLQTHMLQKQTQTRTAAYMHVKMFT